MREEEQLLQQFRVVREEIKKVLKRKKMTLGELADIIGEPLHEVENVHENILGIRLETLSKILSALKINVEVKIEFKID